MSTPPAWIDITSADADRSRASYGEAVLERLRMDGVTVLKDAADMPWGERIAFVQEPEGNVVTLAVPST